MHLTLSLVSFDDVEMALEEAKETFREPQGYNTNSHSLKDIQQQLPSLSYIPPDPIRPWILLEPWLDLVMKSQGLYSSDVHKIELSRSFLAQCLVMSRAAAIMGQLPSNAEDLEFLAESFPKETVKGIDVDQLLQTQRLFVRLDTTSLKDTLQGSGSVKSSKDIWTRLATSARGAAGIEALVNDPGRRPVCLYLIKWDDNMRTDLEYRVFCVPRKGKISAISQYKWHAQWYHAHESLEKQYEIAQRVYDNAKTIHQQIMLHPAMTEQMKNRGFVFDIVENPTDSNATRLIELNDFGAMTGCGSCLFHWLKDAEILYGLEEAVEIRVAV
ncbi:MAG: hypothetical protein Q9170_003733 [Blastenia crenularia]